MVPTVTSVSQWLRTGVVYPRGVYSRVVSCIAYVKAPAHTGFGVTIPLGQKLWLLSVKIWVTPEYTAAGDMFSFNVYHGHGRPAAAAEIRQWADVLPVFWPEGNRGTWDQFQQGQPMSWEMNQLFEGTSQRFGVWVETGIAMPIFQLFASFQISEA